MNAKVLAVAGAKNRDVGNRRERMGTGMQFR